MNKYLFNIIVFTSIIFAQTATIPSSGAGTVGDPYQIENLENLYWIFVDVTRWPLHYIQIEDIDASTTTTWGGGHGNTGWNPIGSYSINFSGTYNGQNYSINNLYSSRGEYGGLFGSISSIALIQNVHINDIDIYSAAYYSAALVGVNNGGTITNCSSTGSVNGTRYPGGLVGDNKAGTITNSYSTVDVTARGDSFWNPGGFVSLNSGTIDNCFASGSVTAGWGGAGGFVCIANGVSEITNSFCTGNVGGADRVGGFAGTLGWSADIINCYSQGNVTRWEGSSSSHIGAFAGFIDQTLIENCYSIGSVYYNPSTIPTDKGFVVGGGSTYVNNFWDSENSNQTTATGATDKTTAEMKEPTTFLAASWDFMDETLNGSDDYWGHNIANNNGYPFLSWQGFTNVFPEINLKQATTDIANGGSYNYGYVITDTDSDVIFTIENTGAADLKVPTSLSITGTNADQYSIQGNPISPVSALGSTTFTVRFSPTSGGAKTAAISMTNNDWNEDPYDLHLNGKGRECTDGSIIYNSETNKFNFCEDGIWIDK